MSRLPYRDRQHAAEMLAHSLQQYRRHPDAIVLGLPRGGVPIAFYVARELDLPMDILLVRKLGVPGQPELAMGAIASGGTRVLNQDIVRGIRISDENIERVARREQSVLDERERLFRGDRGAIDVRDRTVILVDDGLATGSTMRAAATALRQQGPARVIVGVPVASPETCDEFRDLVDEIVCAATPRPFYAVGAWYQDFSETSDEEVRQLLEEHSRSRQPSGSEQSTEGDEHRWQG